MAYHFNWEENLIDLQNRLIWQQWAPGRYSSFLVFEPKKRVIEAPSLEDRIVHHALHRVVEPHFERRFIKDSYACRKGKGTHAACDSVQKHLRRAQQNWGKVFVYQADIAGYFPHIMHSVLRQQIARVIGCKYTLWLWYRIIAASGAYGVGLPIGALSSQLGANINLDGLDHFAKDELGLKHYVRYMDDFVILASSKEELHKIHEKLTKWLLMELGLYYSKWSIYPAKQGINFAGYRTWSTHQLPRKKNVVAAKRRMKAQAKRGDTDALRASAASFAGYMKHCSGWNTAESIAKELGAICNPPTDNPNQPTPRA